jgi:hypothetical protein
MQVARPRRLACWLGTIYLRTWLANCREIYNIYLDLDEGSLDSARRSAAQQIAEKTSLVSQGLACWERERLAKLASLQAQDIHAGSLGTSTARRRLGLDEICSVV